MGFRLIVGLVIGQSETVLGGVSFNEVRLIRRSDRRAGQWFCWWIYQDFSRTVTVGDNKRLDWSRWARIFARQRPELLF